MVRRVGKLNTFLNPYYVASMNCDSLCESYCALLLNNVR